MNVNNGTDAGVHTEVLGKARFGRRFWNIFVFGNDNKMRKYALPVLACFGLAGVLLDLDHFLIQAMQRIRPLHIEYFVCIWFAGICYFAYVNRCIHKNRLGEESA